MLARWLAVGILGFMIGAATIVLADSNNDSRAVITPVAATSGTAGASDHADHSAVVVENGKTITGVKAQDIAAESLPDEPLDAPTRAALAAQLVAAREAAGRLPTVADALAAGFVLAGGFAPGSGAHYVGVTGAGLTGTGGVDAGHPDTYIYAGTSPDSRVVGLMYNSLSQAAPEGFAGPNDSWHTHSANGGLCIKGIVIGPESMSKEKCESLGGHKSGLKDVYMVHDWVVPGWECGWGIFAGECPELGGKVGQDAFA